MGGRHHARTLLANRRFILVSAGLTTGGYYPNHHLLPPPTSSTSHGHHSAAGHHLSVSSAMSFESVHHLGRGHKLQFELLASVACDFVCGARVRNACGSWAMNVGSCVERCSTLSRCIHTLCTSDSHVVAFVRLNVTSGAFKAVYVRT